MFILMFCYFVKGSVNKGFLFCKKCVSLNSYKNLLKNESICCCYSSV